MILVGGAISQFAIAWNLVFALGPYARGEQITTTSLQVPPDISPGCYSVFIFDIP